jgi:hypothetical protein
VKITMMFETPSCEVDSMCRTPCTVLMLSSIFFVTSRSTASGAAPGYTVVTVTIGNSTSGNWSTRSCR